MNSDEFRTMRAVLLLQQGPRATYPLGGHASSLDAILATEQVLETQRQAHAPTTGQLPKPHDAKRPLVRLSAAITALFTS